ncbi:DinB family protein [Spirosoma areae]
MWSAYAQPTDSITDALDRLRTHLTEVPARLNALSEIDLTQRVPGKWSRREILGHLIDSALNNLKRFVDAQFAEGPYTIQGYNQNKSVVVNHYHDLPLPHLLTLWHSLNRQVLYVAEAIPPETLAKPILFGQNPEPGQTLGWLIDDYVAHLEHHLKTLL